jgi:phenylalanyl-tRNA synthetase beta subunit
VLVLPTLLVICHRYRLSTAGELHPELQQEIQLNVRRRFLFELPFQTCSATRRTVTST